MAWYYVLDGQRVGPTSAEEIQSKVDSGSLGSQDYVWTKGMQDWQKIEDVHEFAQSAPEIQAPPVIEEKKLVLSEYPIDEKIFFIRIGLDRGGVPTDYGPYSLTVLKKLYKENRINAKTLVFAKGMTSWQLLADAEDFQQFFEDLPPKIEIEEVEKRTHSRKPIVARMFIENNQQVFEGICRDISIGGMQVLVSDFPAGPGERVSINVHPENTDHHFVADGKIVRVLEGNSGFSFRFVNLSTEASASIQSFLEDT